MEWLAIAGALAFGAIIGALIGMDVGRRRAAVDRLEEHRHVIELTIGEFLVMWRDGQVLLPSMVEGDLHTVALYRAVDLDYVAGRAAMHHAERTGEPASEIL